MDDQRIGRLLRAIRRRRRWRQADLAAAARISQSSVSRAELGHLGEMSVETLRALAAALDAYVRIDVLWRGGLGDRLIDERHASLGLAIAPLLELDGWTVLPEVTFQRFGERGFIDVLAAHSVRRAVCVIESKSVVHSYEETQRRLDVKMRLGRGIADQRLGWRPRIVGAVLVVEDTTTNRRRNRALRPLIRAGLPAGMRQVREWLRAPTQPIRGTWFMKTARPTSTARRSGRPVRRRRA